MNRKKKNAWAALSGAAFLLLLGIVGAVERGASLSLLWAALPALAALAWSARMIGRPEQKKVSRKVSKSSRARLV